MDGIEDMNQKSSLPMYTSVAYKKIQALGDNRLWMSVMQQ